MAGQMVEFSSNGGTTTGFLVIPQKSTGPGVIAIDQK